ncbi:MAG: putative 2OG-Fe(II) oxygenase [Isosphaeraceae bacterium]|nr:putative 2OG-Fe(II) oxygenase [Isosphaeraceae bacterium]
MSNPFELSARKTWPTTFFFRVWQDHPRYAPAIIEHLYEAKQRQSTEIASKVAVGAKSAQGLYESPFDLFDDPAPVLLPLRGFIVASLCMAASRVNGGSIPPDRLAVEFEASWYHITNRGGFHDAHYHPGCSWCGIYYLQAGDSAGGSEGAPGNGVNRFYSPISTGGHHSDYGANYLSSNRIDITPQDGLLFIFPSYLLHSALPYQGARDRVILSFNARIDPADDEESPEPVDAPAADRPAPQPRSTDRSKETIPWK